MKRTAWKRRSESGAAMVELAVLMVAFVPMILIPLYLQDAIVYKLTLQERVSSTAWDFAFGNYDEKSISDLSGSILQENDYIFRNALSGNKREKSDPASPWADFRWPGSGITCTQEDDEMNPTMSPLAAEFHGSKYHKGGLVECQGTIEVASHYVPHEIEMLTFKKNKEFFQEQGEFIEHNDGGQPLQFGIVVDPWTIHKPDDIVDSKGNNLLLERVNFCWSKANTSKLTFGIFATYFGKFMAKAMQKKLLSPALLGFDNPANPKADITVLHPISDEQGRSPGLGGQGSFWVSPYKDGDKDKFEETYNNRKQTYLGCEGALDDGNCGG